MSGANFKQDSLDVSQLASPHLISELEHLRRNCSDVQLAEEEALGAIQKTEEKHGQLKGSCGKCPADWFFHNSSCYFFSIVKSASFQKNWHDSRADCISRGSDLTVIDSPEEQVDFCTSLKRPCNISKKEKKWVWINNVTEVESRYWSPGEPNNHGPDGEDCAVIVYKSTSPWKTRYDAKCQDHKLYWLCETHLLQYLSCPNFS
uniref:CD209 antigen-like protein E n=1 Tax=Gouania willdenowi TaxID=441366 RepID=A0A8C5E7D9_GOUWI